MSKDKAEPAFVEPEFNKIEFLESEKERAKAVIFMFVLGLLLAILSAELYLNGMWYFAVLIFIAILYFIKFIFQTLKLSLPERSSHKLFLFAEFFFTWLVFWIILLNPPFATVSGPQFSAPQASIHGFDNYTALSQVSSGTYSITQGVTSMRIQIAFIHPMSGFTITEAIGSSAAKTLTVTNYAGGYFYFNITTFSFGSTAYFDLSLQSHGVSYSDNFQLVDSA